ncbi:MAG: toprim domain-containing protein [Defluviitaleaceae bacterium]|nr:toprim domain-containing protein [Defluviitaleaceae bacterium]
MKYLADERKIHRGLLNFFITKGDIYQSRDTTAGGATYSNITFAVRDFGGEGGVVNNKVVGAIKRGFPSKNGSGFKGNATGSDMSNYGFRNSGKDSLFVFEAPIDMLSYMTMTSAASENNSIHKALYYGHLATGGSHVSNLINYLKQDQEKTRVKNILQTQDQLQTNAQDNSQTQGKYSKIYLCFDNDKAGMDARTAAINAIEKLGYQAEIICHFPKGKDWNEDLINGERSRDVVKGVVSEIELADSTKAVKVPTATEVLINAINERKQAFLERDGESLTRVGVEPEIGGLALELDGDVAFSSRNDSSPNTQSQPESASKNPNARQI